MNLLDTTSEAFRRFKSQVIECMALLWEVKQTEAWKEKYESMEEYIDQDLGVSKGFASKLLTVYGHYVIEGKVSLRNLRGIDYEKLYLASSLPLPVEKQLAKAETLSRSELKLERADRNGEHECTPITICSKCYKRLT